MQFRLRWMLLVTALVVAPSGRLAAQQGAVAGRVTNAATLLPISEATIRVVAGGPSTEVTSRSDGTFELRLPAGLYTLLVEADDFSPGRFERVRVRGGLTTTRNLPLESQGYTLAGFIVTASRGSQLGRPLGNGAVETEITAPSSSHSVSSEEVEERIAPSLVEDLRESPGVDIGTHGVQSTNVVVRGFNNIFSGALHMLTDYRLAGLPALRVNFMHFLPLDDADVERIEVVLGPGSALYGPNTANGVVHLITKSPLESQGTSLSLAAGERSTYQASFRSAFAVSEDFAVKFSGHLFRGQEWPHVDPAEEDAKWAAKDDPESCIGDRESRGLSTEEAATACQRIGIRNPDVRRYGIEARADWRYSPRGTLVGTYGVTDASGIELTGLGATQIENWIHQFVQARFTYDRWAVQAYFNFNDSGDAYQLRDGLPLVDRSSLGVLQVQNGFSVADGRQDFTYGWDYFSTQPRSEGTIYGDFEDDNDIQEWGLYLQSRTRLSTKVDLVAAGRVDAHSILPDKVLSPRLALVVKPDSGNAIRLSYNRAFTTPTALNYFLDLGAGFAQGDFGDLGYSIRAFGSGRNGFGWQNEDGSLRGMRSPFNPSGAGDLLPVDHATLWQLGLGVAGADLDPGILAVLQGLSPGSSDVGILYFDPLNEAAGLRPLSGLQLEDVEPIREGITETFEAGWTGVLQSALRVSVDVYYMRRYDFVSPLTVETPLLFLVGSEIADWLGSTYVPARVENLVGEGYTLEAAEAQAVEEAARHIPDLASEIGGTALAVASSDVPQMANGGADLIATYRNLGDLSLWGTDVALQWLLGQKWTVRATYSHMSRNWFRIEGSDPLALNAPSHKGTFGISFRDEAIGLNASARVRATGGHPFLSTEFHGTNCIPDAPTHRYREDCIDAYALVDATVGYRLPNTGATLQLGVSNLLNTPYRSFIGVPEIGRMAMARLRYDFF